MTAISVASSAPGRRERTKAANRDAILYAARETFAESGYEASSIRDVVRRTGLAAGTFHNHFPDKESVLRALLEDRCERACATRVRARATSSASSATLIGSTSASWPRTRRARASAPQRRRGARARTRA